MYLVSTFLVALSLNFAVPSVLLFQFPSRVQILLMFSLQSNDNSTLYYNCTFNIGGNSTLFEH